ncbi:cell division control protein 2 homolog isoform X3 [Andrographis paniculata]|nr:cell division control protein 2 homolog isoform X2 [Andrographis paniculata]XP_051123972.1 cell division control protein 2 homolog isoform X2 [Andrographis paniculata]XP_051123980.1 cell division control protein 2 homolog isoform X3 [Andrographis paniculata]XP_051123987.1 cell division control protein 2 homolog isoform X3 [Andrographis paniculata]
MKRYEIGQWIGDGSFGDVFKAYDTKTRENVAIKIIQFQHRDTGLPSEVLREISVLMELDHANVVRLLDVELANFGCCLVFESMDYDLSGFMEAHPETFADPLVIKKLLLQILEGVSYCHSQKVWHRDLKPPNLLINSDLTIKLADFGFARTVDVFLSSYSEDVATLSFQAPEILLGLPYTSAIDIWSVGCIFAELVTLEVLFPGTSDALMLQLIVSLFGLPDSSYWPEGASALSKNLGSKAVPTASTQTLKSIVPRLDPEGLDLLEKMLSVNPHKRITAADALKHPYFDDLRVNH